PRAGRAVHRRAAHGARLGPGERLPSAPEGRGNARASAGPPRRRPRNHECYSHAWGGVRRRGVPAGRRDHRDRLQERHGCPAATPSCFAREDRMSADELLSAIAPALVGPIRLRSNLNADWPLTVDPFHGHEEGAPPSMLLALLKPE